MVNTAESARAVRTETASAARTATACFHCGETCSRHEFAKQEKIFCCQGCLTVHDLLTETGLGHFYDLARHPGIRMRKKSEDWAYLDQPELARRLLDFSDQNITKVTFHIPAIHCLACVWLLENLFQLHPAIGRCHVNFEKREAAITFATGELRISELVSLLASLGYEPHLTLNELEKAPDNRPARKRQAIQIGLAGFAFGNIMLFSLPAYLGMDSLSGPLFKTLLGWLSLALALPVVVYSASDYWRSAWVAARQRVTTLDVPIALGLAAIYAQSLYEIVSGAGAGYCDSLTGLIFFLLCGRLFQRISYDRINFDRDYKSFFPLSVLRKTGLKEETISISSVQVGDHLLIRNAELIPADARLLSGPALLDYSFVTGECEPVEKTAGDYLYAGGQQVGSTIEIEVVKPVSQSYLTSLWNDPAFSKFGHLRLCSITDAYSRSFTRLVIAIAFASAAFWLISGNPPRALKSFTSVLIVACPCALALAAPFALGTAQRLLARLQIFLKNTIVLERLAKVDAIVFDKTGTLTARANEISFVGVTPLTSEEEQMVCSLVRHSTHPHSLRIAQSFGANRVPEPVADFVEITGCGIQGRVKGYHLRLGSRAWLQQLGTAVPTMFLPASASFLAIDGVCRGAFGLKTVFRPEIQQLISQVKSENEIVLLSGDNEKEREHLRALFGPDSRLLFNQSPQNKLDFVRNLEQSGHTVMMVGDGLNDAGALKQSDIGVAVVENIGAFSPASDIILEAAQIGRLSRMLEFARRSCRIVRFSFGISAIYNAIGIAIAAAGLLSPVVCAFLMPLSSISVVLFACSATKWAAERGGFAN